MHERMHEFFERVRDDGQWFDRGVRVEFFRVRPNSQDLEKAALGSYEVLGCERVVDGSGNGYLRTACDYVHLNPVRARLLKPDERLLAYPWSSLGSYLAAPEHRPLRQAAPVARRRPDHGCEARA